MIACRLMLVMGLCLWGLDATAQTLKKPKEFYFEPDPNAVVIPVSAVSEEQLAEMIRVHERGDRRGAAAMGKSNDRMGRGAQEAAAKLARMAFNAGRPELGGSLYEQARGRERVEMGFGRGVTWNYGWDLYRAGNYEAALAQWSQIANSAPRGLAWIPPTLAVVLWQLDRKDEAVDWYAAAVRTEPQLWNDAARLPGLLPDWREEDRAVLAQVLAAWQKAPPSWP